MLLFLKAILTYLIYDYVILNFSRIADNVRLVEVYRDRKIYATFRRTPYGPRVIYTVDMPYYFYPANDYYSIKVYSIEEARFRIDRERYDRARMKFLSPLRKMKVIR
jgi:hypothetical protein